MSRLTLFLRYILITLAILVTNVVVFTLSPGNLIAAIIPSITIIAVFLPDNKPVNSLKQKEKLDSSIIANKDFQLEQSARDGSPDYLNGEEMSFEESELHSMLGNVFNKMAKNASHDMYSSEITGTDGQAQVTDNSRESYSTGKNVISTRERAVSKKQPRATTMNELFSVNIDVTSDGKLHYIFQEGGANNRQSNAKQLKKGEIGHE